MLFILSISLVYQTNLFAGTWNGSVSTEWGNSANWTGIAPGDTPTEDVIIPIIANGNYPILSSDNYSIKKLTIQAGATLNQSGGYLTLNDDLVIVTGSPDGTYNMSGGTLQMKKAWKNVGIFYATGGTVKFSPVSSSGAFEKGSNQFFNIEIDDGVQPTFDNKDGNNIKIAGNFVNNNPNFNMSSKATFTFTVQVLKQYIVLQLPQPQKQLLGIW